MSKVRTEFRCGECGAAAARWAGRCPGCSSWNTLVEERMAPAGRRMSPLRPMSSSTPKANGNAANGNGSAVPIAEVDSTAGAARSLGMGELDRVLGGGLVPGSVTLVGGEPGIGKSTLLLQMLALLAAAGHKCLLVSAEESPGQVRLRAERLGALRPRLLLLAETELSVITESVEEVAPDYLVVDSIQTIFDSELLSAPGTVAQVRECAHQLVRLTKERTMATVLVGHVTKEGNLAGPRVLEHVVDTVLTFEGERHHALRLLRAVKHRFGATSELGLFEMTDGGLVGVPDAGSLFLADRRPGVAGSVVVPTIEGNRPLLVEIQALVAPTNAPMPRRSAQGLDQGRLGLLLAVLETRVGIGGLSKSDVYASAVGGVRVVEPGADLAIALALASAGSGQGLAPDLVVCAEVGLGGELRQVAHTGRRLAESARLGFGTAIVAESVAEPPPGMTLVRCASLADAVRAAGLHK